jgi:hypothetical protein
MEKHIRKTGRGSVGGLESHYFFIFSKVGERSKKGHVVMRMKPNFLVLFLDDHGWGDVGANWNETTETPRMDQLAAEGVRFTDFHASYSVCTASRGALLTGRLAPRTGVASNFGPYSTHGMALQERTIANELNDLGYESHMIGKVRRPRCWRYRWGIATVPG